MPIIPMPITKTIALLSTAAILCTSAALAQPAPPAPPPGGPKPGAEAAAPQPPPPHGGPRGPRGGLDTPPPPQKAAQFRLERGDIALDVKCAADEPMKACADIALQMLDKLAAIPATPTTPAASPMPAAVAPASTPRD